jgi:hypothetical protein
MLCDLPTVQQRVHRNELVGYLPEQGGFEVLNLPAIAQRSQTSVAVAPIPDKMVSFSTPSMSPPMC